MASCLYDGIHFERNAFRPFVSMLPATVKPDELVQQYDILLDDSDVSLCKNSFEANVIFSKLDSLIVAIEQDALAYGVNKFLLHFITTGTQGGNGFIDGACHFIEGLRQRFGQSVELQVDLLGLLMQPNYYWGIWRQEFSMVESLQAITKASRVLSSSGADYILTVGRLDGEVKAAEAGLVSNCGAKVASFSTNAESALSYFNPQCPNNEKYLVGQSLASTDFDGMLVRTILDILEGSSCIVQKPMTSFHILREVSLILDGVISHKDFVSRLPIKHIFAATPDVSDKLEYFWRYLGGYRKGCCLAGYNLSGNVAINEILEERFGAKFAWKTLSENYMLCKLCCGSYFSVIIDRRACWYAKMLRKMA